MSLLRAALGLGLLLLGLPAQKLESHRKHHKHRKVLLSHGRSRYELVESSSVVNDKDPEDYFRQTLKSSTPQVKRNPPKQQRVDSGPSPVYKLDSAEEDTPSAVYKLGSAEKDIEEVEAVMPHAKLVDIAQARAHTERAAANAAEGLEHIRQELRLSKKKKHEIQVLKQSLAVEQKLLDESSGLQLASKDDDESETMVQSQVQQLDDMKIKLRTLIGSKTAEATKASHQAEEEAKAMREAATVAEQKAEQEMKKSKEIIWKAGKLEKIAEKQLGKLEQSAKPANH